MESEGIMKSGGQHLTSSLQPKEPGYLTQIDATLVDLQNSIQYLAEGVVAVSRVGPDAMMAVPEEAPENQLHGILLEVQRANRRIRQITSDLTL